ncbi:MAG: hypothetical protein AAB853_05750 [Patescibacteria group bacterium]
MQNERTVSTREFLRNFRTIKQKLLAGTLHIVRIDVGREKQLQVTPVRRQKTLGDLLRAAQELPHPIRIRRTHIFDQLLRPRRKR